MPQTTEGLRSHLDYWLYGLVRVTADLGNTRPLLRALQEATIRKLLGTQVLDLTDDLDAAEILRRYNRHLDHRGILDADDLAYHRRDGALEVTVGSTCPYRATCDWLHADGIPLPCFRAIAMGELLRLVTRRAHEARLARFSVPCHLTITRGSLEEVRDGD